MIASAVVSVALSAVVVLPRNHKLCASADARAEVAVRVVGKLKGTSERFLTVWAWGLVDDRDAFHDVSQSYEVPADGWVSVGLARGARNKIVETMIGLVDERGDFAPLGRSVVIAGPACVLFTPEK